LESRRSPFVFFTNALGGSFAIFAAIRCASSLVSNFAPVSAPVHRQCRNKKAAPANRLRGARGIDGNDRGLAQPFAARLFDNQPDAVAVPVRGQEQIF
jgi:hypothetical protein